MVEYGFDELKLFTTNSKLFLITCKCSDINEHCEPESLTTLIQCPLGKRAEKVGNIVELREWEYRLFTTAVLLETNSFFALVPHFSVSPLFDIPPAEEFTQRKVKWFPEQL